MSNKELIEQLRTAVKWNNEHYSSSFEGDMKDLLFRNGVLTILSEICIRLPERGVV